MPPAEPRRSSDPRKGAVPSILGPDLFVTGTVECEGEVQIDGRVDGTIKAQQLTVGESGQITGDVRAEQVRVFGTLKGLIVAREVNVMRTARIEGDIHHEVLAIEAGARVEGNLKRAEAGTSVAVPNAIAKRPAVIATTAAPSSGPTTGQAPVSA